MKKIIGLIIVISLLLTTLPLGAVGENAINKEQVDADELNDIDFVELSTNNEVKLDDNPRGKISFPERFKEPEYVPGELILKLKDNLNVNLMSFSNEVETTSDESVFRAYTVVTDEETITMLPGETVAIGDEPLTIPGKNPSNSMATSTSSEEVLTIGIESIDALNMEYGAISAEMLFEDETDPSFSNIYKFKFPSYVDMFSAALDYNDDPNVEFAEPNYIGHLCDEGFTKEQIYPDNTPNDPYFDMQWALHNTGQNGGTPDADIDAPESWGTTMGDEDVVIAILDTGVDYTNPDLGNCTEGIVEEEFILESWHPLNDTMFKETISFPGYDSVSLHFSRINPGEAYIEVDYHGSGTLGGYVFGGNYELYDYWLVFTTYNSTKITIKAWAAGDNPGWGFKIDKVKLSTWIPLSEQSDKYVDGYDVLAEDPDPMDDFGHGTHCAGIIAAVTNNDLGIAGVAGNCKIMPIRVLSPWFSRMGAGVDIFSDGILYAVKNDADVISLSIGYFSPSKLMEIVLNYANLMGVVIVAAAGNDEYSVSEFCFPASHDKVIAVGATDRNDTKAIFTNYGAWVDVSAPGCDILSLRAHATDMYNTWPKWEYCVPPFDPNAILYRASGTSMSAPHVAGVAALLLSKKPYLTPREVLTILRSSTDSVISDKYIGTGRVNAHLALQKAAHVVAEIDDSFDYKNLEGTASIKGTAKGLGFKKYKVEYGEGVYPDSWYLIGEGSTKKYGGKLASWDTTKVDDGYYSVRLTVIAGDFSYEDRSLIIIDNHAEQYYVDEDYDENTPGWQVDHFDKIQDTILICGKKDKIYVASGTYPEMLSVEKGNSVTLIGEDLDNTIIDASNQRYKTILLYSGSINISGFTLRSCSIMGVLTSNNVISGNKFTDPSGNLSSYPSILLALYTSNNKISDNIITTVRSSIDLGFSAKNNEISGNTLTDGGITITGTGKYNTVSGNSVKYIDLYSKVYNNDITDNTISNGKDSGLFLAHARYNKISNNLIENIAGTEYQGNYYPSCGIGMLPSEGFDLMALLFGGIPITVIKDSFLNEISNNTISNCDYGIYLSSIIYNVINSNWKIEEINATCKLNVISHNDISNTDVGIWLEGACENIITGNTLSDNNQGVLIEQYNGEDYGWDGTRDANNNWLYYNNFIDNVEQAYDECDNLWYRPLKLKGNYWSDYTGEDNEWPFGIGDTPYYISGGNNKDKYPLMEPCEESSQYNEYSEQSSQQQSSQQQSFPSNSPTNN